MEPENADAHNDYGVVLTRIGDIFEVRSHFRRATELDMKHADAQYSLDRAPATESRLERRSDATAWHWPPGRAT